MAVEESSAWTSPIPGVLVKELNRWEDARGWLVELFRDDELPAGFEPVMGYLSQTKPGVARGPHEHREQSDGFVFMDGDYDLYLWDNRPGNAGHHIVLRVGANHRVFVVVPPGVVHGYKNVGQADAIVLNFPDALYAGRGKSEPVDEIRHEQDASSPFRID